VIGELAFPAKCRAAECTGILSTTHVNSHMLLKIFNILESFVTRVTTKGNSLCVISNMLIQLLAANKRFPALATLVSFPASMAVHVLIQLVLEVELKTTHGARVSKRLLVGVSCGLVFRQRLLRIQTLTTIWAEKLVIILMGGREVLIQVPLPYERLWTELTRERTVSLM